MVYTKFNRTVTRRMFTGIFYSGVLINGSDPCFESKLRGTN